MKRIEENKLVMFKAVQAVLAKNQTAVDTLPALVSSQEAFAALNNNITETDRELGTVTVGKVASKENVEKALTTALLSLKGALASYARKTNNTELSLLVKFTKSSLKELGDTDLENIAKTVLEIVEANKAALVTYGVDQAEITGFIETVANFKSATAETKTSFSEKSGARVSLTELFKEGDAILKDELDNLMLRMQSKYPDFYKAYKSARVIKNLGGGHNGDGGDTPTPPPAN